MLHEGPLPQIPDEFLNEWQRLPQYAGKYAEFMEHMLTSGKCADVTFLLNEKVKGGEKVKVKAHKSILKKRSQFFDAMLSDRWMQEEENVVKMTNTGFTADDFKMFLKVRHTT